MPLRLVAAIASRNNTSSTLLTAISSPKKASPQALSTSSSPKSLFTNKQGMQSNINANKCKARKSKQTPTQKQTNNLNKKINNTQKQKQSNEPNKKNKQHTIPWDGALVSPAF